MSAGGTVSQRNRKSGMMTDDELRALVREAVARHLGRAGSMHPVGVSSALLSRHASHVLLPIPGGSALEGRCLIEPAVTCSHCGYCQSYGH